MTFFEWLIIGLLILIFLSVRTLIFSVKDLIHVTVICHNDRKKEGESRVE